MSLLTERLTHWESAIHRIGGPQYYVGEPGLLESEVVSRLSEAGLEPVGDLVDWFSWHNGGGRPAAAFTPPSPYPLLPLRQALEHRDGMLSLMKNFDLLPVERQYRPQWVPLMGEAADLLVLDSTDGAVWQVSSWDEEFSHRVRGSLAECVDAFCRALDSGRFVVINGEIQPSPGLEPPPHEDMYLVM